MTLWRAAMLLIMSLSFNGCQKKQKASAPATISRDTDILSEEDLEGLPE